MMYKNLYEICLKQSRLSKKASYNVRIIIFLKISNEIFYDIYQEIDCIVK